jgi:hypothetical protein
MGAPTQAKLAGMTRIWPLLVIKHKPYNKQPSKRLHHGFCPTKRP